MFNSSTPDAGMQKSKKNLSSFSLFQVGTLAIVLITLILTFALVWFGITVKLKVTGVEQQWRTYSKDAAFVSSVVSRIQTNFGYGGFIHNFKNYVLRRDEALIPKIEKSLAETQRAINDYPLHGIFKDFDDEIYINNLTQVVDQYVVNFELAKRLIAKGVNSNEIDRRVKVNDAPAFHAIKHLSQHSVEHNKNYVLETSKRLNNTLSFINLAFLLVPFVMLSGIFMLVLWRKTTEFNNRLEDNRLFLRDLFDAAPDAMLIVDGEGIISEANQRVEEIFGSSEKSLVGTRVESLIPQRFREQHVKKRRDSFVDKRERVLMADVELYALGKDNNEIPVEISLSYTIRNDKKYAIVILRDITKQKRVEEHIQYLAQYDQLTKLPNRSLFNDRLQHSIERAQRQKKKIGVMFLDLDGFKDVNDSLGHQAGDELLKIIAERLLNVMRTEDTVARYGGDEFTIILEALEHSDHVAIAAKKVLQTVGEIIHLSGHEVTVGVSIGISIYPDDGTDTNGLIINADAAMYQSKKHGKNCYKFYIKD